MVVIIVGILVGVLLPRYFKARTLVRASQVLISLDAMRSSLERYRLSHNNSYVGATCGNLDVDVQTTIIPYFDCSVDLATDSTYLIVLSPVDTPYVLCNFTMDQDGVIWADGDCKSLSTGP